MTSSCTTVRDVKKVTEHLDSKALGRTVYFTVYLPTDYPNLSQLPTLFLNDGQDAEVLKLEVSLRKFYQTPSKPDLGVVAIHTNEFRMVEYGTSGVPDYKNRGHKAAAYEEFVMQELMAFLQSRYPMLAHPRKTYFAGFSLGGLSAFDIAWNNPQLFSKVGVFSGSFWWRKKAYEDGYDDHNDRIMHVKVRNNPSRPNLKFWFECGGKDEDSDRNNNGIIDSIDDTQDLIKELVLKGYQNEEITYVELPDGEHNYNTWSAVFPQFLEWLGNK